MTMFHMPTVFQAIMHSGSPLSFEDQLLSNMGRSPHLQQNLKQWYLEWSLGMKWHYCWPALILPFQKQWLAAPAGASSNESCFGDFGAMPVIIGTCEGLSVTLCIPVTIMQSQLRSRVLSTVKNWFQLIPFLLFAHPTFWLLALLSLRGAFFWLLAITP